MDGVDSRIVASAVSLVPKLEHLYIASLRLHSFPLWIRPLRELRTLACEHNSISELPDWVSEFAHLEKLWLSDNTLKRLPASLRKLKYLSDLNLRGNPALSLPAELTESKDADRILDYYFRVVAKDALPLNEFKLVLVGRGGVGKTTLVHRLVTGKYKEFKRTPGIKITKWPVQIESDEVQAHVWDFGGQEIMHGTHRFFMTERALYLVFISGREGNEDHDAEYWLSLVRSFAGDRASDCALQQVG
jgi:internalin A